MADKVHTAREILENLKAQVDGSVLAEQMASMSDLSPMERDELLYLLLASNNDSMMRELHRVNCVARGIDDAPQDQPPPKSMRH